MRLWVLFSLRSDLPAGMTQKLEVRESNDFIIPKALPPGTMNRMRGRKDEYGNENISFTFHNSVEQAERKQKI